MEKCECVAGSRKVTNFSLSLSKKYVCINLLFLVKLGRWPEIGDNCHCPSLSIYGSFLLQNFTLALGDRNFHITEIGSKNTKNKILYDFQYCDHFREIAAI